MTLGRGIFQILHKQQECDFPASSLIFTFQQPCGYNVTGQLQEPNSEGFYKAYNSFGKLVVYIILFSPEAPLLQT